uniref:Conserved oligomeric Golgi complex subunit 2 n=1 Tax=Strongyloides venezuelensis TaxID=75913 RepID=A0A0K0FEB3_STRVS
MISQFPSPKIDSDSGQVYSFNKTLFTRPEFNVERFINLARHRATLDEISGDLRSYLKTVQEELVELINVEYADFVNLSSSLVSLNDVIERIGESTNTSFNKYCESTFQLKESANQLNDKREKLSKCYMEQISLRNKINFVESSKRFIDLLEQFPAEMSRRQVERFSMSLADLVNTFEACKETADDNQNGRDYDRVMNFIISKFTKLVTECLKQKFRDVNSKDIESIMSCLQIISQESIPMEIISHDIVSSTLNRCFDGKDSLFEKLTRCLETIIKTRNTFLESSNEQIGSLGYHFIDSCLLKGLQETIKNNLASNILINDTTLFQKCFFELLQFVKTYPRRKENKSLLVSCLDQFNMHIYFKLITSGYSKKVNTELGKATNRQLEDIEVSIPNLEYELDYNSFFSLEISKAIVWSFNDVSNEKIVLDPLLSRSWTFLISNFNKLITFLEKASELEFEEDYKVPIAIISDVQRLEESIMGLCYGVFRSRIENLRLDWRIFGNVFDSFFVTLREKSCLFEKILIEINKKTLDKYLIQVNDVPKSYRWTKKPMPESHSQYLSSIVDYLKKLEDDFNTYGVEDEVKEKMIVEVREYVKDTFNRLSSNLIQSIQQTFSSLQRFKNREDENTSNVSGSSSDEAKMLKQLELDKIFVCDTF